jgi:membrane protein YqaA with SNARE-associated domain
MKPAGHHRVGTGVRHLAVQALDWMLPEDNPAEAIYGTITIGALLAGESALRDTYPETVGSVVVAILIYWLARSYATLLGRRLTVGERLSVAELGRALAHDWAIVRGAGLPLIALLAAWAAGSSQQTGAAAALWTCVGSLLAFELLAGLRTRAQPAELALDLCVGATMGLGVVALKVILH